MSAIYILWLRELKRYVRSKSEMVATIGQTVLYLLSLGYGLSPVFRKSGEGSYLEFIAPGIIAMTVFSSSLSSGVQLVWDRQFGSLKTMLVTPVPRMHIMIGRTCGAATTSLIQGLLVALVSIAVGFRPTSSSQIPLAFLFLSLIALLFTAVGTTIGSMLKDMQGFQMIANFLVLPLFFFSGALFPLEHLPRLLAMLTTIDPLSYGVDGLRGALIGKIHYGWSTDLGIMAALVVGTTWLGAWSFSRIEI